MRHFLSPRTNSEQIYGDDKKSTSQRYEFDTFSWHRVTFEEFVKFLRDMIDIKEQAQIWAESQTPEGKDDGPQDAMRHAMWMCLMTRQFGRQTAIDWGWAHEEGNIDRQRAIMDSHNSNQGRLIGTDFDGSCADGVRQARAAGWLIEWKGTEPTGTSPRQNNPPGTPPA